MGFFKNLIEELVTEGNQVDIACNEANEPVLDFYKNLGCKVYPIDCSRSPFSPNNIKAIFQLRMTAKDYDIVHCHTPIAAMCTRLACHSLRKKGLRVIYTAHGFHFYKGAPLLNWLLYYPVEWICAFMTDTLITINKEDYNRAKKHMHAKQVEYVPGVGIDVDFFKNTVIDRDKKREELGVPKDAFVILSVGELNENKNHKAVIEELNKRNDSNIHYVIAGEGPLKDYLQSIATNCNLHLIGYRNDCNELYKMADLYVLPSKREGLNVSLIEAKAAGCKTCASCIRGNMDIKSDFYFSLDNYFEIIEAIEKLTNTNCDKNYRNSSNYTFDIDKINIQVKKIYG